MKTIEEIKKEIEKADDKIETIACLPDEEQDALIAAGILQFKAEWWNWNRREWEFVEYVKIDRDELQDFLHAASLQECYMPHEVSLLNSANGGDWRTVIVYDGVDLEDPVEAEDE